MSDAMHRASDALREKPRLIVVGNGMVGHRFVQVAAERELTARWSLMVVGEENRTAYDRVHLSQWFEVTDEDALSLVEPGEYERLGVSVITGDAVIALDREARCATTSSGRVLGYDKLVLATGSRPFVPEIEGRQLPGCFVYRTLDDLAAIRAAAAAPGARTAAVIGGG
ncbi:MAG: FAD-dependent oxidoreductase, partial [Solirubrobacteraceae bacterium]